MAADSGYDYKSLAKQRMLWAIKPILGVCIVVWVLHPSTATEPDMTKQQLKAFLVGAIYGLIVYREALKHFLNKQKINKSEIRNRIPEEYYMGHIEKVLRGQDEREV